MGLHRNIWCAALPRKREWLGTCVVSAVGVARVPRPEHSPPCEFTHARIECGARIWPPPQKRVVRGQTPRVLKACIAYQALEA